MNKPGRKTASSKNKPDRKNQFVLIADDDTYNLSCISILLGRFGYQILKSATGKEALATATRFVPSLIMLSPELPDMSGFDVMRQLRHSPATSHIPLIGLTRQDSREMNDRCMALGATGFLCKPLDAEKLYRTVQAAIEKNPRSHLRVRTVLPVKVHSSQHDSLYGAYTLALSTGGMFLRTMNPVSVNSEISLEFDLNGRAIVADTVVIYNCQAGCGPDRETGVGLRFVEMTSGDRDTIRNFIKDEIMNGIPSQ